METKIDTGDRVEMIIRPYAVGDETELSELVATTMRIVIKVIIR